MARKEVVVFSSINAAEVHLVQSALTREGLESRIKGNMRAPLAGEVPFDDARVELSVPVELEEKALAVISAIRQADGADQVCLSCGETNPASFEICWQCGADLPDA